MGWRTIEVGIRDSEGDPAVSLVGAFTEFAEFHGLDAFSEHYERANGKLGIRVIVEGNSSSLNDMTGLLCDGAEEIAYDIAPNDRRLLRIARLIGAELRGQLTGGWGVPSVTTGRASREVEAIAYGQVSPFELEEELVVHSERIRSALKERRSTGGVDGWRDRRRIEHVCTVDLRSLVRTARILSRVGVVLGKAIPRPHTFSVMSRFEEETNGLVAVRNVLEHMDEYVVGKGRLNKDAEPGAVLDYRFASDDVVISALDVDGLAVSQLVESGLRMARCLQTTIDHFVPLIRLKSLIDDFQFIVDDPNDNAVVVAPAEETESQVAFRSSFEEALPDAGELIPTIADLEGVPCPSCGDLL